MEHFRGEKEKEEEKEEERERKFPAAKQKAVPSSSSTWNRENSVPAAGRSTTHTHMTCTASHPFRPFRASFETGTTSACLIAAT